MPARLAALTGAIAVLCAGCAAQSAVSVEPTSERSRQVAPAAATPPRPTAAGELEARGPAELVRTVDTTDKVVFLTIDDGLHQDPALLSYLAEERIPVTVFLTTGTAGDWRYWQDMDPMASIQNHTVRHSALPKLGNGQQREICAANATIAEQTGRTPWMLRPPYGAFDTTTLTAAGACGLDYVVHWSVTLPDKRLRYQSAQRSLQAGDIILTHFTEDLREDLPAAIRQIRKQGFEVARLEDYLIPRGWQVGPAAMRSATSTESKAYPVSG